MISVSTIFDDNTLSLIARIAARKYKYQCYILAFVFLIAGSLLNILTINSVLYEIFWLASCLFYLHRPRTYYKKVLKQYHTREREIFQTPRTVWTTFEDEQISSITIDNNNTLEVKYSTISKLYETDAYLMIMTQGKQCLPIPKDQISNGSSQDLIAFLQEKAPTLKHIKIK